MRTGFGLFMLTVLVSSMVNAIVTWRRERQSQSEKEMAKIKDSLLSDGTKVIEQVEKGKLTFLRDYLKEVNKKLMRTGTQTKVTASVSGGYVTITGTLQYETQRRTIMRAANQVSGVRQVVDQMTVQPKKRVDAD